MTPGALAQVAALLAAFAAFVAIVLWLLRPGARAAAHDAAEIPFREDEAAAAPPKRGDRPEEAP